MISLSRSRSSNLKYINKIYLLLMLIWFFRRCIVQEGAILQKNFELCPPSLLPLAIFKFKTVQPYRQKCWIQQMSWTPVVSLRSCLRGFPGGAVVGSPPANAGDAGLSPGLGGSRMSRSGWALAPQLLSLRSGARMPRLLGPARLEPVLRNEGGHRNEKPVRHSREWPPLATAGGSPRSARKTQRRRK